MGFLKNTIITMAYIDRNGEKYWIEAITDAIARRSELNHLDFKEDLSEKRTRLIEHVNAFGNTPGGGAFVFGITRSFKFSKTALDFDKIATEIVNIAKDKQEPGLSVEIHILKINGHSVLCAHVQQGVTSPYSSKIVLLLEEMPASNATAVKPSLCRLMKSESTWQNREMFLQMRWP